MVLHSQQVIIILILILILILSIYYYHYYYYSLYLLLFLLLLLLSSSSSTTTLIIIGTEHAAKCSYSSKRILCPIDDAHRKETAHYYEKDSKLCEKRIPTTADEVCTEQYYWKSKKISDALYITSK